MMSCPAVPSDPSCSGRGVCVGPNTCDCGALSPGWTGVGDMVFGSPSCSVFVPAVQALWAMTLCVALVLLPLPTWCFYRRLKFRKQWLDVTSDLYFHGLRSGQLMCTAAMSLLRATRPMDSIGNDIAVTVLFVLNHFALILTTRLGIIKVLRVTAAIVADSSLKPRISNFLFVLNFLIIPYILTQAIPLTMLSLADYAAHYWLTTAFYLSLAMSILAIALPSISIAITPTIHSLRVSNLALQHIAAKFEAFSSRSKGTIATQLILGCLIGFVPVLNRAGPSYFIPIQASIFLLSSDTLMSTFMTTDDSSSAPWFIRMIMLNMPKASSTRSQEPSARHTTRSQEGQVEEASDPSSSHVDPADKSQVAVRTLGITKEPRYFHHNRAHNKPAPVHKALSTIESSMADSKLVNADD